MRLFQEVRQVHLVIEHLEMLGNMFQVVQMKEQVKI